jgi:hypothetical protein
MKYKYRQNNGLYPYLKYDIIKSLNLGDRIMAQSVYPVPESGGIPTGITDSRPASPATGDVFYNGTTGILEIYNGSDWVPCSAPPGQPTIAVTDIGTSRAYGSAQASVDFTPNPVGGTAIGYTTTASTGGYTATSTSDPVLITVGNSGSWSFTGTIYNGFGTSVASSSVTQALTTVPDAPTIGTAADTGGSGSLTLTFTAPNTGGKAITNYKYSTDGTTYTAFSPAQTTSPLTVSGLTNGVSTTVRLKAVNANGDSSTSSASNSATPTFAVGILSSTTYTIPSSGTYILKAVGGGGSSGGNSNQANGGGSGYYTTLTTNLTAGDVLTINIGAAGAITTNNGGTTTIVKNGTTIVSAAGGDYGSSALGNGGSGGGGSADGGGGGGGVGGYSGSNGASGNARAGGSGALGLGYGSGNNANYPLGGSGSYAGASGGSPWAGINGFGAGAGGNTNQVPVARGSGGGGATWAQPAKAGSAGLVVITQ